MAQRTQSEGLGDRN